MKFETILKTQVDMEQVDLEALKPWISCRITEILNHDDDVVINYVYNQLEPQFPNPKEIQSNLSGFFSLKNARLFLAELWNQLLDSMTTQNNVKLNEVVNNKIKIVPKRLSSEDHKLILNDISHRKSSEYVKNDRHYESRSYTRSSRSRYSRSKHSRISYSRSNSSDYHKYRHRYRSRSRYSRRSNNLAYRRSHSRSSTGHTPYTRYSDYTDDGNIIRIKSDTEFSSAPSPSSSSESSSSHSQYLTRLKSSNIGKEKRLSERNSYVDSTDNSLPELDSIKAVSSRSNTIENTKNIKEGIVTNILSSNDGQLDKEEMESLELISLHPKYSIDFVSSRSPTCYSSRSELLTDGSSESSSSEYTIEYVESSELINNYKNIEDSGDSSSTWSDIEWVTKEEYEYINNCSSEDTSSSSSRSSSNESSNSQNSYDNVEWIEDCHLVLYSEQYDRVL